MSNDLVVSRVLPLLVDIRNDSVANIRLNIAKSLAILKDKFFEDSINTIVIPLLEKFMKDDDRDVRYFAEMGLKTFNN